MGKYKKKKRNALKWIKTAMMFYGHVEVALPGNIFQPSARAQKHPNNITTQAAITIFHIRLTWIIWHLITPVFHIPPDIPSNISGAKQYEATGHKSPIYWRCHLGSVSDLCWIGCHFPFSRPTTAREGGRLLNLLNYLYYHKVICSRSHTQFHIFVIIINHWAKGGN